MVTREGSGEDSIIKDGNRLDDKNTNRKFDIPEYIIRAREVRKLLQDSVRESGWPQMPDDVSSLEGLFAEARKQVGQVWDARVLPELQQKFDVWADALEKAGCDDDKIQWLRNPEVINSKITIHQFGGLEDQMRTVIPDAWRELVLIGSERQLAELTLARHWIKELDEDGKLEMAKRFGFKNAFEIELALDSAAILGKYIDQAYVKQIELADMPGGSSKTPLKKKEGMDEASKRGVNYLYDRENKDGELDVKTYREVFPFESNGVASRLITLKERTERGLEDGRLGNEYKGLPEYLQKMADAIVSDEKDPAKIYERWEEVSASFRQLMEDGCPIMLMPQKSESVAGAANKIDWEIRFNFRTAQSKELERDLQPYRELAGELNKSIASSLDKPSRSIPQIYVGVQFTASGPNTNWYTRGEAGEFSIVAHTNAVLDVARVGALPTLRKVFGDDVIEQGVFEKATLMDNSLHELGHTVATKKDNAVMNRVSDNSNVKGVEELKADSTALKLVLMRFQKDGSEGVDYRAQLYAKLGDVCDYLRNKKEGESYYIDGLAIISRLLDKQILVKKENGQYRITDDLEAIKVVAGISDEIVELYTTGTPEKVKEYLDSIIARGKNEDVKEFIKQIKS